MGVIYAAEDVKLGRHAAAKFVNKEVAWRVDFECSPIILNGTMERGHWC
jgi:hypothetical protein